MPKATQPLSQKDRFLKAALRLFAKQGYAATSTRQICHEVGLAHSAIYNYFPSKESILMAIEEREMLIMQAGLDAALRVESQASPRDKLAIAIRYSVLVATSNNTAWRLMAEMLRSLKPHNRAEVVRRRDTFERTLRELIEHYAICRGRDDYNATLITRYFFGICEGVSGWYSNSGDLSAEAIADDVTQFFMDALDAQLDAL